MTLALSPAGRRYGYLKDPQDLRDLRMKLAVRVDLPQLVDLTAWCGPVKDQGSEGSCTAHAGTANREYLIRRLPEYEHGLQGMDPNSVVLSPAYLYYASRLFDGDPSDDAGSFGRTVCRVMNWRASDVRMRGVCLESTMPYKAGDYTKPPTDAMIAEAQRFTAGAYHRLNGGSYEVKSSLASGVGYPVLIGFNVYDSFESDAVARSGVVPMPNPGSENLLGGHETLIIGYNDGPDQGNWPAGHFKVRNSWGSGWGDGGNFYLPYAFVDSTQFTMDLWMQHLGKPW